MGRLATRALRRAAARPHSQRSKTSGAQRTAGHSLARSPMVRCPRKPVGASRFFRHGHLGESPARKSHKAQQGRGRWQVRAVHDTLLHHSHHCARRKAHFFGPSQAPGQTKLPQRAPPPRANNKRCRAPTATTTCRSRRCRRRVPPGRRATATATRRWPTRPQQSRRRRRPRPAIRTATRATTTCRCPSSNRKKGRTSKKEAAAAAAALLLE